MLSSLVSGVQVPSEPPTGCSHFFSTRAALLIEGGNGRDGDLNALETSRVYDAGSEADSPEVCVHEPEWSTFKVGSGYVHDPADGRVLVQSAKPSIGHGVGGCQADVYDWHNPVAIAKTSGLSAWTSRSIRLWARVFSPIVTA